MRQLYFYPTLNEENASSFGIKVEEFSFYYNDVSLKLDEGGVLRNPTEKTWLVQNNGMIIKTSVRLESPEKLYGHTGVACTNAQIGFYAVWSNPSTMQSGSCKLESLDGINFELTRFFAPETINGTLTVTIHAFVEKSATTVSEEETFLMNDEGVSIGIVAVKTILLNDNHLSFPIIKVKEDDKPLWWAVLDWDDPAVDRFDNSVTVFLNKKFKSYPHSSKDAEFLCTIISSVYFLIIKKIRSKDDEVLRSIFNGSDEFEEFSVCNVMEHFFRLGSLTFDKIKNSTDEKLMEDLQKEINSLCGGALR